LLYNEKVTGRKMKCPVTKSFFQGFSPELLQIVAGLDVLGHKKTQRQLYQRKSLERKRMRKQEQNGSNKENDGLSIFDDGNEEEDGATTEEDNTSNNVESEDPGIENNDTEIIRDMQDEGESVVLEEVTEVVDDEEHEKSLADEYEQRLAHSHRPKEVVC